MTEAERVYADIVQSMKEEIELWQSDRRQGYKEMLLAFTKTSRDYHMEIAKKWDQTFKELHDEFGISPPANDSYSSNASRDCL